MGRDRQRGCRVAALDQRRGRRSRTYRRFHPQLGSGEIETLVLASTHQLLCLTNDRQAKAVCRILNRAYLDLEDLLRTFKIKGILTIAALKQLIEQIEEKDRTLIKAKDQILKE